VPFSPTIERWRGAVDSLNRIMDTDPFLANMIPESGGIPGRIGYFDTGSSYTDEEIACGLDPKWRRRALGLCQVAPGTLRSYNSKKAIGGMSSGSTTPWFKPVTPCQLAGTSSADALEQIRVGLYVWANCLFWSAGTANVKWQPDQLMPDEILLMTRLRYHRGNGAVNKKLDQAAAAGFPRTFAGLEAFDPDWGKPDRPFHGARIVLASYKKAMGASTPTPSEPPIDWPTPPTNGGGSGGAAIAILALLLIFAFSRKR